MSTIRQNIMTAVGARLALITIAHGYATNAGATVYEWKSDIDTISDAERPCLLYYDTDDTYSDSAFGQYREDNTLTVIIEGIGDNTAATARKLIADIHAAINTDRTWGGLAEWTSRINDSIQVREAEHKIISAACTISIRFQTINFGT